MISLSNTKLLLLFFSVMTLLQLCATQELCDAQAFEVEIENDSCTNQTDFEEAWNSLWTESVDEIGSDEDKDGWHTSIAAGNNRRELVFQPERNLQLDCHGLETCTKRWCCLSCPYCRRRELRGQRQLLLTNSEACQYINTGEDSGTEHTCLEGADIVCTAL